MTMQRPETLKGPAKAADGGAPRYLIVTADDFGRTGAINRGVIAAHEKGIVTSASLMVTWPSGRTATRYARTETSLSVGLQVDLGEWVCRDDSWIRLYEVVPVEDPRAVVAETRRQLELFRGLVGRDPTHVTVYHDGEEPIVRHALIDLAGELGVPLRDHSPIIRTVSAFYGQTSRGYPYPEGVSVEALIEIIRGVDDGYTELVCHPGVPARNGRDVPTNYRAERGLELETLCDSRVRRALGEAGVELRSFDAFLLKPETGPSISEHSLQERGINEFHCGEHARSERSFKSAIASDPDNAWNWVWLARSQAEQRKSAEAMLSIAAALERTPEPSPRPSPGEAVAQLLFDLGDPEAALAAVDQLEGEVIPRRLLTEIGYALRRRGHVTDAARVFARILDQNPADAPAHTQLEAFEAEALVLQGGWLPPRPRRRRARRALDGRVLHLVNYSLPHSHAGYTVRTHQIARAQMKAGLEPYVATRLGFPWDVGVEAPDRIDVLDGIEYHRISGRDGVPTRLDLRLSETVERLAELAHDLRPSIIHAHSDYRNALVGGTLARRLGVPMIYEVRGFWEETRLLTQGSGATARECYRWHRDRELEGMLLADGVVTLSSVMRKALIRRGVPREQITVIPNGVNPDEFAPRPRDSRLARRIGLPRDHVVVGYVSSLTPYEGLDVLVEAIGLLRKRGRLVSGLIIGDGSHRGVVEAHVRERGLDEAVTLVGRVPFAEVTKYYSLIDIFVVPRTRDRVSRLVTPLKPFEAMAMAKAIVVSDVAPLREIVLPGRTGLVFRAGDAKHLASLLGSLIDDPHRIGELGEAARAWVCRNRTWSASGERYRALYESLTRQNGAARVPLFAGGGVR